MIRREPTMPIPAWSTILPNMANRRSTQRNLPITRRMPEYRTMDPLIGTGLRLDGQEEDHDSRVVLAAWSEGAALTWSAWIKFVATQPDATIFNRQDGANAFRVGVDNAVPFVEVTGANGTQRSPAGAAVAPNSWHHLAIVAGWFGKITLFLDGEQYAVLNGTVPALNSPCAIGGDRVRPRMDSMASSTNWNFPKSRDLPGSSNWRP